MTDEFCICFVPQAFSGVSYSTFVIKVPAGQSVGVDFEELHLRNPKSKLHTSGDSSNQFAHTTGNVTHI